LQDEQKAKRMNARTEEDFIRNKQTANRQVEQADPSTAQMSCRVKDIMDRDKKQVYVIDVEFEQYIWV
jgi:hypothetical protein